MAQTTRKYVYALRQQICYLRNVKELAAFLTRLVGQNLKHFLSPVRLYSPCTIFFKVGTKVIPYNGNAHDFSSPPPAPLAVENVKSDIYHIFAFYVS